MTKTKMFAGASLALLMAGSAQAATFDFTFFAAQTDIPDERPRSVDDQMLTAVVDVEEEVVGTGVMSYDGPVAGGALPLEALTNLTMSFTIGEWSWDEGDFAPTALNPRWFVADHGDFFSGAFFSNADDLEMVRSEVGLQAEPACRFLGSVLLFNGEQCLIYSPHIDFPDQYAVYEADGMMVQTVQAMPAIGDYVAIARVGTPPAPVPLPATLPLLALAVGGMGYLRARRS